MSALLLHVDPVAQIVFTRFQVGFRVGSFLHSLNQHYNATPCKPNWLKGCFGKVHLALLPTMGELLPPTFLRNLDHVELLYAQRACHFKFILYEKLRFSLDRSVLEALRLFIKLDYLAFAPAHLSRTSCSIHKGSNLGTSLRKLAGSSVTTYRS